MSATPNNFGNLSNKDMELMMERYKLQLLKLQKASTPSPTTPAQPPKAQVPTPVVPQPQIPMPIHPQEIPPVVVEPKKLMPVPEPPCAPPAPVVPQAPEVVVPPVEVPLSQEVPPIPLPPGVAQPNPINNMPSTQAPQKEIPTIPLPPGVAQPNPINNMPSTQAPQKEIPTIPLPPGVAQPTPIDNMPSTQAPQKEIPTIPLPPGVAQPNPIDNMPSTQAPQKEIPTIPLPPGVAQPISPKPIAPQPIILSPNAPQGSATVPPTAPPQESILQPSKPAPTQQMTPPPLMPNMPQNGAFTQNGMPQNFPHFVQRPMQSVRPVPPQTPMPKNNNQPSGNMSSPPVAPKPTMPLIVEEQMMETLPETLEENILMPNTPVNGGNMHNSTSPKGKNMQMPQQETMQEKKMDVRIRPSEFPPLGVCNVENSTMTTSLGQPVDSHQIMSLGENGPVLLRDTVFVDKLAHFDRERIPERVVHAKGAGAFGSFTPYGSMSKYTKANFLSSEKKTCPVFVRFSTVIGASGSADTARDPRGFAVKFYTDEGNYDIVGLSFPVFFIHDSMKFPDFIHSLKPSPLNNCTYKERFFDFASQNPETTHAITFLYSDEGTVRSYRTMNGFGVNTYVWVNAEGKRHFVKYHWKSQQGVSNLNREEALRLAGENPNVATQDLFNALANGEKVRYELFVQLLDPDVEQTLPFNPLDDTKVWDENLFPLMPVGMLTLDKNPENFFVQVEQSAFAPSNVVPGIELSSDKMLEGRSFSYADAHRYRLGANFAQLPINAAKSPVHNHQIDGQSAMKMPPCPNVNYAPNLLMHNQPAMAQSPSYKNPYHSGNIGRYKVLPQDDFTQAGERYRHMSESEKSALVHNLACDLINCTDIVIEAFMLNLIQTDKELAQRVAFAISAK